MAKLTRVQGLERLKQRVLQRLPANARVAMREANEKNADEFMGLVGRILTRGDDERGHLADTLKKYPGSTETAVRVSLGDATRPYPLSLEAGHLAPDGTHVPGQPAWNPARRVLKKKAQGRQSRALSKALKATST